MLRVTEISTCLNSNTGLSVFDSVFLVLRGLSSMFEATIPPRRVISTTFFSVRPLAKLESAPRWRRQPRPSRRAAAGAGSARPVGLGLERGLSGCNGEDRSFLTGSSYRFIHSTMMEEPSGTQQGNHDSDSIMISRADSESTGP